MQYNAIFLKFLATFYLQVSLNLFASKLDNKNFPTDGINTLFYRKDRYLYKLANTCFLIDQFSRTCQIFLRSTLKDVASKVTYCYIEWNCFRAMTKKVLSFGNRPINIHTDGDKKLVLLSFTSTPTVPDLHLQDVRYFLQIKKLFANMK